MNQNELLRYIKTDQPITLSEGKKYLEIIDMPLLTCKHGDKCCAKCFKNQCVVCSVCDVGISKEVYETSMLRLCSLHSNVKNNIVILQ